MNEELQEVFDECTAKGKKVSIEEIKLCYRCQKKLSEPIYFHVDPLSIFDFIDEPELYCRSCKKIIESLPEHYGHFVEIKKRNNLKETI